MRMSRWWSWFALVLIFSGTPARLVEAAADRARTMAEVGSADRVEEEDGGVGDDALEAALTDDTGGLHLGPAADAASFPRIPARASANRASILVNLRASVSVQGPPEAGRRQAWLGRFRF